MTFSELICIVLLCGVEGSVLMVSATCWEHVSLLIEAGVRYPCPPPLKIFWQLKYVNFLLSYFCSQHVESQFLKGLQKSSLKAEIFFAFAIFWYTLQTMLLHTPEYRPPEVNNVLFQALCLEAKLWTFHLQYKDRVSMQILSPWAKERGLVDSAQVVARMEENNQLSLKSSKEMWLDFEQHYQEFNAMIEQGSIPIYLAIAGENLETLTRFALKLKRTLLPGLALIDQSAVRESLPPAQDEHFYFFQKYLFTVAYSEKT